MKSLILSIKRWLYVRVLHIWNPAGVASTLAKYQARILNWKTWVITRKYYDRFGLTVYGEAIDCSAFTFKIRALIKSFGFNIIHIHALDEIVPLLKALYPFKKNRLTLSRKRHSRQMERKREILEKSRCDHCIHARST